MHDCHDHIHHEFKADSLDKNLMSAKLNDLNQFKGFDDFMYFSYKYWPLIKEEPENINKAKHNFIELSKKFNKLKGQTKEQVLGEAENFSLHLDQVTKLITEEGDVHTATVTISKYVKPFTIQEKFIRNFNKKLASAEI